MTYLHEVGHSGIQNTYMMYRERYFSSGAHKKAIEIVNKCNPCQIQRLKLLRTQVEENLQPTFPWQYISMDLFGPLPITDKGYKYILNVVDLFSGYPEAFPIRDKTHETVIYFITKKLLTRIGVPELILTDRGSEFCSNLNMELCKALGIQRNLTSPYSPRSNAKIERYHQNLKNYLLRFTYRQQNMWADSLEAFLLAYRAIPSCTTGFSPHFLNTGQRMRLPLDTILSTAPKYYGDSYVETFIKELHTAFTCTRDNTKKMRTDYRDRYNKKVENLEYQPGQLVFYYKNSQEKDFSPKLNNKWLPYYSIVQKLTPVNYEIVSEYNGKILRVHKDKLYPVDELEQWDSFRPFPRSILERNEADVKQRERTFLPRRAKLVQALTPVEEGSETELEN